MEETKTIPRGTSPPPFLPGTSQYAHGTVRLDALKLKSYDPWLQETQHWTDSATGKAAIEIVARATLGAFFFSWMEEGRGMGGIGNYRYKKGAAPVGLTADNWLHWPSYIVDRTIGEGIKWVLQKAHHKDPDGFLRFRELRQFGHGGFGRSLGAEMTVVTASFAAMSAGTGIVRSGINSVLNPRMRRTWLREDGSFGLGHALKRLGKESWTIITKNAGEDVWVALPYVISMRWWRNIVSKLFHGFQYSSDHVDNGGGIQVDDKLNVTGHYAAAGALDLQGRFTIYNVYTQFYRDTYDRIGERLLSWQKNGFRLSAPEWLRNPLSIPGRSLDAAGKLLRYFTVSSIRSVLQMTPAVPFFWAFRVPQGKKVGLAVHPDFGALTYKGDDGESHLIRADQRHKAEWGPSPYKPGYDRPLFFAGSTRPVPGPAPFADAPDGTPFHPGQFTAHHQPLSHQTSARLTDAMAGVMERTANSAPLRGFMRPIWSWLGVRDVDKHIVTQNDAAWAYAPYMAMKGFTRDVYVNDQMNLAIGRMVDGFLSFNWKEFKEGIGEVARTCLRLPVENPASQTRLVEQHLHNPTDRSPIPADWSREKHHALVTDGSPDTHHIADLITSDRARKYADRVTRQPSEESRRWADGMIDQVTKDVQKKERPRKRPTDWTDYPVEQGGVDLAPSVM